MGTWRSLALCALALGACAGCGSHTEADAPRSAALSFERAVQRDDGVGACALLAPDTRAEVVQSGGSPCRKAIVDEDLPEPGPVDSSSAFGTMAQVRFTGDTVFLAEFRGRWKVLAAGCSPVPGAPYDCSVKGG